MLQHLLTYAEKRGLVAEEGFNEKRPLKWLISFDNQGKNPQVIPLGDGKLGQQRRCPDAGTKAQGKEGAHFLADKLSTIVLYDEGSDKPSTDNLKFNFFVDMLQRASSVMPLLSTAANAINSSENITSIYRQLKQMKKPSAKGSDFATLQIGQTILLDCPEWIDWWRKEFRLQRVMPEKNTNKDGVKMRCLLTGELIVPAERHESKVQGLKAVGGRGGDSLISFDKDAFSSYYLQKAFNAATSGETAKIYVSALNDLLSKHKVNLGNAYIVYWFKQAIEGTEADPLSYFTVSEEKEFADAMFKAKETLEALISGKKPDILNNEFYAMLVSGSSGRVMVRDWHEGSIKKLITSLQAWFDDLSIISINGEELAKWTRFERVITALLAPRKPDQDYGYWIKPIGAFSRSFWRAAIARDPFPNAMLGRLVTLLPSHILAIAEEERKRPSERSKEYHILLNLLYRRMGLIKAYLIRKGDKHMQPYLNPEHPHPAYHCGRLLAVLARLQRKALGDLGAGVVQRYYAAASQTPGLILGRLVRNAQNHLSKPEMKGKTKWIEDWLQEIHSKLRDNMPRILTLEEQSLFALGYYQQLAALNVKSSNNQETDETNNQD